MNPHECGLITTPIPDIYSEAPQLLIAGGAMSDESLRTAGVVLVVFPTVVFGGASILWHWITRHTTYYENPLRQRLWRAGHAHAGVLLLLSLVALMLVDLAELAEGWRRVVRTTIPAAAILLPVAYFLSVVKPDTDHPNRLINLAYVGGLSLAIGTITLGIGLLRAA
jgi:hypothetical protein